MHCINPRFTYVYFTYCLFC